MADTRFEANHKNRIPDLRGAAKRGLYDPSHEHDACGVGVVADINGGRAHKIIEQALQVLVNLEHRGACGCDPRTGDGAGILFQMPHRFMSKAAGEIGVKLPKPGRYAVGMVFLPNEAGLQKACKDVIETQVKNHNAEFLGWRVVPVEKSAIGDMAGAVMPSIQQFFVAAPESAEEEALERLLFIIRKRAEAAVRDLVDEGNRATIEDYFYVCSFSARTIVYKGLLIADQMKDFYRDLSDATLESAFGLVHSRFSTNTLGSWKLAHPYRFLAHNGEINTVRGNRNWMAAREDNLASPLFGDAISEITPVCEPEASDTASLDNAFEMLWMSGRSVEHVAAMTIPAAWFGHESMKKRDQDFFEYHFGMMEPWDGPAMVVFTDGKTLGATLDRNGLRPFRYLVTKDNLLVMGSETGVLQDIPADQVAYRDRLGPGRMFLVDFVEKRIVHDDEVMERLGTRHPYGQWLEENRLLMDDLPMPDNVPGVDLDTLVTRQMAFGYTQEDLKFLIGPMSQSGAQPLGSMGNDAPLAVLSDRPQPLFNYFKQLFAQVSNPPLDPIREKLVTQMAVPVGRRPNILEETPEHCRILRIDHPVLRNADIAKIKAANSAAVKPRVISTLWPVAEGQAGLGRALDRIRREADEAIGAGCTVLILSDRGIDLEHAYVPSLLATGAVHHHLVRNQKRNLADIIVESAEPREVHHFAGLYGYGASAINPYLAFETLAGMRAHPTAELPIPEQDEAEYNFCKAVESGVLKTMSKMGVSTLQGYIGAQQFEALGISQRLVDECFTWTASRIGGVDLEELADDVLANHARAFREENIPSNLKLDLGGLYLWRGTGERHMWNPDTIGLLQDAAVRNDRGVYDQFEKASNEESEGPITIRGLLTLAYDPGGGVPLDEVEPIEEIVKRFATGAISLGSISREAHETLAIAMNRIGARSNTGEGGEDPERYTADPNGDSRNSAIKQVASGRFGVTTNYAVHASDLQIKMAQGAKPGEGGELPGWKVSDYIAFIRKTTKGVELISPPPHHDIYSIEDLAQLIHDLKNVNPDARIHVKLVSEVGVGIIAAGVSKGKADVVLISGDSGGTGASPLSSIRHGGLPWELGVAETQQVLVENGLRDRIVVQTDGQIKTGRDVAIAALLGADEWGVATASLITMGCIMLRKCHLNTCSVGVATQDPELRRKFAGSPEAVVNYFLMLAQSLREEMAKLGFRTVNDMIGRVDKLRQRTDVDHPKAKKLDFSRILAMPRGIEGDHPYQCTLQDHGLDAALDQRLIKASQPALRDGSNVEGEFGIINVNRTVGAMMSGEVAKKYGEAGLPDGTIKFRFHGSAGQSFGAFLVPGVEFTIAGDTNDYFGKSMSGGRVVVVPHEGSTTVPENDVIIGNVALYGATGGEAYIRGKGGERFCVRNSAARAVIEGIGDHGCEYMTGGRVVVLGPTGRNFGAGMSGGIAYVWDPDMTFVNRFNDELADLEEVTSPEDERELKELIEKHRAYTGSTVAEKVLADWKSAVGKFRKVMPRDFARVLKEAAEERARMGNGHKPGAERVGATARG